MPQCSVDADTAGLDSRRQEETGILAIFICAFATLIQTRCSTEITLRTDSLHSSTTSGIPVSMAIYVSTIGFAKSHSSPVDSIGANHVEGSVSSLGNMDYFS